MSRAAPLLLTVLAGLAVAVTNNGGLDVSGAIGALRLGILINTASSLALVTLAGVAFVTRGAAHPPGLAAMALGALAAVAPSPAQLVLAASLGAGARPAVVAALGAMAVVGGAPDRLQGLGAEHAVGVVVVLIGLLTARGPLAPTLVVITASLGAPALWASGWGRVALISGGVGLGALVAVGAVVDRSRASSALGWAWVGLGLAAMGAAAAPLGLAVGLGGLSVAGLLHGDAERLPATRTPWVVGLMALAAGVVPTLGAGAGREVLLGLIVAGDPAAAAGVLGVSAATGYSLGRAAPTRLDAAGVGQTVVSLLAAPLILGLGRWLSPMVATPRAELSLIGVAAGAITLGAALWAHQGGRLPERSLPPLPLHRPWPLVIVAPTVSAAQLGRALVLLGLAVWAAWTVAATVGLPAAGLERLWDR